MFKELRERLAAGWRFNWLTGLALWHAGLRDDWTDEQFDAAIAEIHGLAVRCRRG